MAKGTGDKDTAASGCGEQAASRTMAAKGSRVQKATNLSSMVIAYPTVILMPNMFIRPGPRPASLPGAKKTRASRRAFL
jgi:hypothetical protein